MIAYTHPPHKTIRIGHKEIASFISHADENIDWQTVESFGEEWGKFHEFSDSEINRMGDQYFDIVDDKILNSSSSVLDVGCGSGRWSRYIAKKAGAVEAVDPSNAVYQALKLTEEFDHVRVTQASVDSIPFADESFDLVFSLGVLHHIPDTADGIRKCVSKVKKGGHFLVYLYYDLDQRGVLFRALFFLSNILRLVICKLPGPIKRFFCDALAVLIYLPFVLFTKLVTAILGPNNKVIAHIPLSYYQDKSFQVIRNDSLDRFGTPLERRFTKVEIRSMLEAAGLTDIVFSTDEPYWHAVGKKN
ncbi:MAG: putative methyltransferase [Cytophagaceae bacterium]|jgi:SAM-dependent methyltransferase|nr:putative methyltransferase [Cytophagaceae bacterium]